MPAVNPELEAVRQEEGERITNEHNAKFEAADNLIAQCEECALTWSELAAGARERICRQIQLADRGSCYSGLADLLGVDGMDARFCAVQVAGQLKSSTELMLEDVTRSRGAPLPAGQLLRFLRERRLLRALSDASCAVQEACARRQQQLLLGRAAGSPMDSGYQSSVDGSGAADFVGVVSAPADATLVKAVPVRSAPRSDSEVDLQPPPPPPPPPPPGSKKLMLTYAQDGRDAAFDVAKQLKGLGFRVLLLEEQRRRRQPDPYPAVQKWFTGMDYIVPVLTAEYLAATQNLAEPRDAPARDLAADARFVYTLMCSEMERNGHVNWRVRAVVPDGGEEDIRDHPLYGSPLFRYPFLVSDLDMLAECLGD